MYIYIHSNIHVYILCVNVYDVLGTWVYCTQHPIRHEEKAGHRLAKTGQKNRKYEGEGATSKAVAPTTTGTTGMGDETWTVHRQHMVIHHPHSGDDWGVIHHWDKTNRL